MDNITSIIVVALIIAYSVVTQSIKDKRAREKRMLESEETPTQPRRIIIRAENAPKGEGRVKNKTASTLTSPAATNTPKRAQDTQKSPKKQQNSAQQQTLPENQTTNIDFDIERAVIEAEILKPKYLEY